MDKIVPIREARATLPSILKAVSSGRRYVITQRSHARAVLISLDELESLEVQADKALLEDIKAAKADIRAGRYIKASRYLARKTK